MPAGIRSTEATDMFFQESSDETRSAPPPESWRLFGDRSLPVSIDAADRYREVIHEYFAEVNIFFPLLSLDDILATFNEVVSCEKSPALESDSISPARYCLLLLVLCMGSFVCTGEYRISLNEAAGRNGGQEPSSLGSGYFKEVTGLDEKLWQKARLLLGFISSEINLEAAQCSMRASLYKGAKGRMADSFHWVHATAVKCEALARRAIASTNDAERFSDAFRRLYWVSLIYEGDFISEVSITLPSGIARYEDVRPLSIDKNMRQHSPHQRRTLPSPAISTFYRTEELVAFQISTNAAIRRFLNRVNSVIYDSKDQVRMTRDSYANWLLRVTEDLWSHHGALYRNLPDFLLTSQPRKRPDQENASSPMTPGIIRVEELGNNPWNVLRLKDATMLGNTLFTGLSSSMCFSIWRILIPIPARRRFFTVAGHAWKESEDLSTFLISIRPLVLPACSPVAFTFTMVMILRVATVCPVSHDALPSDIEQAIFIGKRNLRRFSISVTEFQWHLGVLERLEASCKNHMTM
ncbi:C6 finger domain-containing protein [Colletotrichum asianum]